MPMTEIETDGLISLMKLYVLSVVYNPQIPNIPAIYGHSKNHKRKKKSHFRKRSLMNIYLTFELRILFYTISPVFARTCARNEENAVKM